MGDEISRFQIASLETRRKRWNWAGLDVHHIIYLRPLPSSCFEALPLSFASFSFRKKLYCLTLLFYFITFEPHLQLLPPPPLSLLSLRNMAIHHLA